MRSCSNCLLPETAEATTFDSQGTCSVCKQIEYKEEKVDWPDRRRQLDELVSLYKDKGLYDCIVPFSGGKDSVFVAHQLKYRFGMNPLCTTWAPFEWTDVGWENLNNFVNAGFFNLIAQPNGNLHRKLSRVFRAFAKFDLVILLGAYEVLTPN